MTLNTENLQSSPIPQTKTGRLFCFGSTVQNTDPNVNIKKFSINLNKGFFTYHKRSTPSNIQTTATKFLEITFVPFKVFMQLKKKQGEHNPYQMI